MKNRTVFFTILVVIFAFVNSFFAVAQKGGIKQPYLQDLKFKPNGKFKIMQLTDIHYVFGAPESEYSIECIQTVISAEKPDLIILTGDLVTRKPVKEGIRALIGEIAKEKIPYVILFGNHDDENGVSRTEFMEIAKTFPYNLSASAEGISGIGNCIFALKDKGGKNAFILYCFDSHAYSKIPDVKGYGYFQPDQIQWYRKQSTGFAGQNGGTPVPSLAFFHIPLPEYNMAASDENAPLIGTRYERSCSPILNSGMFLAMKEMGDVMATFTGHDHDNDYVTLWKGILLCYGRFTGSRTTYTHLVNGCRLVELTEGETGFKTWIRLRDNLVLNEVHYPEDVLKKNDE